MNISEIIVNILETLSNGNEIPSASNYKMDLEEFANILEKMQDSNLIKGIKIMRAGQGNKVFSILKKQAEITLEGLEYLNNNL